MNTYEKLNRLDEAMQEDAAIIVPLINPGADVNLQELIMDGQIQATGVKKDEGKPRWELLPFDAIEGVVEILTFGAKKYDARNWEKGIVYGRVFGATMRHLTAWWRGEDKDKESGRSHLEHAMCELMFLSAFEKRGMAHLDDRPKKDLPF